MRTILAILLLTSTALTEEPKVQRDLPYAEPKNERQTLDVYAPPEGKDHPIVFWIHGGGWMQGDKKEVKVKPQAFVDKGFVFVSTNYRMFPDVKINVIAQDVAKAISWTHGHAKEFGGDPNRIFVMGHSAGAQLAALVCTDNSYLKAEGLPLSIIKGCVPVDGDTYDVPMQIATVEEKRADRYKWKFGDEKSQKDLSPVSHVAKGRFIPPFLILHVADHPETKGQSERLVKALQEVGVSAKAFPAQDSEHDKLNDNLGLPEDKPTKALFEFLDSTNLVRVGNDDDDMSGVEVERNEKTSTIRITRKKRFSAVGSSMFVMKVFCDVAKARKCEYFVNLEEGSDGEGRWIYTAGFTNKKDADIKQEFGDKFSDTNDSGQERKIMSVSEWTPVFQQLFPKAR